MPFSVLASLRNVPNYPALTLAILLLGLGNSVVEPYTPLFGVNVAHMSPLQLGIFQTLMSVSGIWVSSRLAHRFDRKPSRRPALLTLGISAIGFLLLTTTTNYALLAVIAFVFLGPGAAPFPQLFAIAKGNLDQADPSASRNGIITLRSIFSLAWAIGPLLGAGLLARFGFHGLFLGAALLWVCTLLVVSRLKDVAPATGIPAQPPASQPVRSRPIWPVVVSFGLFYTAMGMGIIALPIYVTRTAHGSEGDVGLMFGLSALLEVVVMLGLFLIPGRFSSERLIRFGMALFVLYFALVAFLPYVGWLVVAQAIRAVSIALIMSLGISYFQSLMPERVGFATTLFSNTAIAAEVIASLGTGLWAQAFGYAAVFPLCAVLAAASWALMFLVTRR